MSYTNNLENMVLPLFDYRGEMNSVVLKQPISNISQIIVAIISGDETAHIIYDNYEVQHVDFQAGIRTLSFYDGYYVVWSEDLHLWINLCNTLKGMTDASYKRWEIFREKASMNEMEV